MPEVYIGNNSAQSQVFYRSADDPVPVRIEPGRQAVVDVAEKDLEALIAHNGKYGMTAARDGEGGVYPTGLIWSTDGPIPGLLPGETRRD